MTGSLVCLARSHCGILHSVQDDIAVFRVTPPWEGKGEAFSLDFECKVTTKIFGTWLCCHLLSFAVIYFSLLHLYYARLQRIMDGKYFFARRRSGLCFSAKRYARDEHSALRQRLCVMMISDINISLPAHLTSIIPPYNIGHIYVIIYTTYI